MLMNANECICLTSAIPDFGSVGAALLKKRMHYIHSKIGSNVPIPIYEKYAAKGIRITKVYRLYKYTPRYISLRQHCGERVPNFISVVELW